LDAIIQVNRQNSNDETFRWMYMDKENVNTIMKQRNTADKALFVDFEYTKSMIYMIGIYYNNEYKVFWADDLSLSSEKKLMTTFYNFIKELKNIDIWYWHAEKYKWRQVCYRHNLMNYNEITERWYDLCDTMRKGPITIHGALHFSLKSIVHAFYIHGKIPFDYIDLECQNGSSSIDFAENYYESRNDRVRIELEKYNCIDTEAMFYILLEIQKQVQMH
jgi:hypothetical protein